MFEIRQARTRDGAEVARLYEICRLTGAAGSDASALTSVPTLLGEVYLGAYLKLEPSLAYVMVDSADQPVGYAIGTADSVAFSAAMDREWWPLLREQYPADFVAPDAWDAGLVRNIHAGQHPHPATLAQYPAHFHVDLLPQAQGGGNGRRLLATLFDEFRERGVGGVHLGVDPANVSAVGFYRHLGFTPVQPGDDALLGIKL